MYGFDWFDLTLPHAVDKALNDHTYFILDDNVRVYLHLKLNGSEYVPISAH